MTRPFGLGPYGVLPGLYKAKGLDTKIVMAHWRTHLSEEERLASYTAWRDARLEEFTAALWPRFDFEARRFVGPATRFAEALTAFELGLMIEAFFGEDHILSRVPTSPLAKDGIEHHGKHYVYEDEEAPGYNFDQYDRTLSDAERKDFLARMLEAVTTDVPGTKAAGHFWFKNQMQRPRPLHAAMAYRLEPAFVSELSSRGQHPSIVSGHCFQGIMMGCAVLEHWIATNPDPADDRREALAQYMVDVGDRRVFAGVHFPSDNIASWVLALALIPEVFDDGEAILGFARDAILRRSEVFSLVIDRFPASAAAEPALALLERYGLTGPTRST